MNEHAQIRLLRSADVSSALALSTLAGWNQTGDDWNSLLHLAPEGCFCVEINGHIAATATLLCYGDSLAWIGMVLTHPEHRGKGFARRLLTHVIERADAMNVRTLKLDATAQGQPLYDHFGFIPEQAVERWTSPPSEFAHHGTAPTRNNLQCWFKADLDAFGADRSHVLNCLVRRGTLFSNDGGYLLVRTGRNSMHLGPLVALQHDCARDLIELSMASADGISWSWDLLPTNEHAVVLATQLGFAPERRLVRMRRGRELKCDDTMTFATAGFEFG